MKKYFREWQTSNPPPPPPNDDPIDDGTIPQPGGPGI